MPNPKLTLLGFPLEVRENIFKQLHEVEHGDELVCTGEDADLALPLHAVRPLSIMRVSQSLRREYLEWYFRETSFQLPVSLSHWGNLPVWRPDHDFQGLMWIIGSEVEEECKQKMEWQAECWLSFLAQRSECNIRKVQYRFMYFGLNTYLGAALTLEILPLAEKSRIMFRVDDGWQVDGLGKAQLELMVASKVEWIREYVSCLDSAISLLVIANDVDIGSVRILVLGECPGWCCPCSWTTSRAVAGCPLVSNMFGLEYLDAHMRRGLLVQGLCVLQGMPAEDCALERRYMSRPWAVERIN